MALAVRRPQTMGEEIANAVTHGIGALLSVAGLAVMVSYATTLGDAYRIVGAAVFGITMVLLYLASTIYHSVHGAQIKPLLRKIDHASIYLLIAGTYTPFTLVSLPGAWGWSLFGIVWGLAVFGVAFKLLFIHKFEFASVLVYLLMGWLGAVAVKPIIANLSTDGLVWVAAGGLFYTGGVLFYMWRRLPYHHAIWHCFVMGGTFCHFFAVHMYVLPPTA
jgi:hemolysin III